MPDRRKADERWMTRALELARRGEGLTRPNPPVGAVVVRRGRIVGEGHHRRAGGPHAEVVALRAAGARARGATLYVTLEPCCTWGRTPPCTDAILAHGVRRVVACVRDPNPRHAGRGLRLLRSRGVQVDEGVLAAEGLRILAPFAKWITTRRPYVTLKLGVTADGRIADKSGRSRWITGPLARRAVHAIRRRADAILIGGETARVDDPALLPVPSVGRKPWRVVVSSNGALPLRLRLFSDANASQTVLATTDACGARVQRELRRRGVTVLLLPRRGPGASLRALMGRLGRLGILHVLCEGGGRLAAALIREGLADELLLFVAPRLLGGEGRPALGGAGWSLAAAPRLNFIDAQRLGPDILLRAIPEE